MPAPPPPLIVRSARRKRTIALRIQPDGTVKVTAPLRTPMAQIMDFLRRKADWIADRQKLHRDRAGQKAKPLAEGSMVYVQGARRPLALFADEAVPADAVPLDLPKDTHPALLQEEIRTSLSLWYKKQARRLLPPKVAFWAQKTKLTPSRLGFSDAKGSWGTCNADNAVRLNWRLILVPPELLDYVIVHELAHIAHKNHSARFWALVARFVPDWKEKRRALRGWDKADGVC